MTGHSMKFELRPIANSNFGVTLEFETSEIDAILDICRCNVEPILDAYFRARGLMLIPGLRGIRDTPEALVELSRLFGPEVENYHGTLTADRFFHDSVAEILILSNKPPCNHPPPSKPSGYSELKDELPISFPHQTNWHTDQSYRRPPPDISLLLAIEVPPRDQGQTLYADCTAAYQALEPEMQQLLQGLDGIHAPGWIGRSRESVRNGEVPLDLLPHQLPQRHPLVRRHPVTGELSLYICEENQMDYIEGPIDGMEPGAEGAGAELIHELLAHATQDAFVYVHEWDEGDLVIGDNRNQLHCATWFDTERYNREMWRTTVMGNPGEPYGGEEKSWIPRDGSEPMAGMEHA